MNTIKSRISNKKRRAVGAIIGGVILAAIMVTTVLVYFTTILSNEKAKTAYELEAAQANQDQAAEKMLIARDTDIAANNIAIRIDNEGSQSLVISKLLLYCVSPAPTCPSPAPSDQTPTPLVTLNGGESDSRNIGSVVNGRDYRIDIISERGNIVSAKECKVSIDAFGNGICENDPPLGEDEDEACDTDCRITEGIIQGTGYVQLDFKAFGSIYPTLGDRQGVNQKGWLVETSSPFTKVTGYPAFEIMYSPSNGAGVADYPIVFVESMRNLDLYNETLTLSRSSSLLTNIGKEQSGQPDIEFICNATKSFTATGAPSGGAFFAYNESTRPTILDWVPLNASQSEGWEEVYFCTSSPGTATVNYAPRNTFNSFHPLFVVLRGSSEPSHADYGQTIPYQSALPGGTTMDSFEACLRTSNSLSSACPGPATNCSGACVTTQQLIYTASLSTMTGIGQNVWVRMDAATTPVTVSWIYSNGTQATLDMTNNLPAKDVALVNQYVPLAVQLPKDVTCDVAVGEKAYTIKVTDQYDSSGRRNVYYMTWKVTC